MRDQMPANERQQLGQLLASIPFEGGKFTVSSINLMKSQLQPTGAVYSRINSVSLLNS
jgi:2'-5' RNA ligase